MALISRGFRGRGHGDVDPARIPPGQYVTTDFPVLSAGPTPHTPLDEWSFAVGGAIGQARSWTWEEFLALPSETVTVDIHCVTKWSKFAPWGKFVVAWCDGGYTTNQPLADVTDGKAWVAYQFGGEPLDPEHGGPARLLVPHLYFWKSAKWIRGINIGDHDEPGFWEGSGYHNYGDPWTEQRSWND